MRWFPVPALVGVALSLASPLLGATAASEKPHVPWSGPPVTVACEFQAITFDWNFSSGSYGFWTGTCDAGGVGVWEYGPTTAIPDAPPNVWGTTLSESYPDQAGAGLVSHFFTITTASHLVEITHYFDSCSVPRGIEPPVLGGICSEPMAGGLHHRYFRRAA